MKKTINFCCLLMTLSFSAQKETLKDWIFPTKNNFLSLKSKTNPDDFFRINYFKISDNLVGTSLEIGLMNSEPSAKLFEIGNDEISLIKTKDGASIDIGGEEYDFGENNIYFKLPTNIGTTKWSYADDSGTIYYGLCYWKEGKEKFLVIERQMSGRQQFPEKTVEYYSKDKGLIKHENINIKTGKITESYAFAESGFDSQMDIQDFPLFHSLEKDNSSETKIQEKITDEIPHKISYPDGTIPKEYLIQVFLDKGLPYSVKDTLIIKNKRGIDGIPAPRYSKQDQSIYYDGKKFSKGEYVTDMKISSISYFKKPFSFHQELYYSDGEGVLKKVVNRKIYVDIDYKLNNSSNLNDYLIKEAINKTSNIYNELSKKMTKQGIYLVVNKISEENVKSQRIIFLDFQEE